jgi:hypothetical protein
MGGASWFLSAFASSSCIVTGMTGDFANTLLAAGRISVSRLLVMTSEPSHAV